MRPLEGVTVVDLSRNAPGPFCSMLLADLGARVVEVGGGRAGVALPVFGRGKQHVTLNLQSPAGRAALHALVARADVFIEGYRPGVAARLGAGYDELHILNPRLVYCSLTGWGQDGPLAQVASHDIDYLAIGGLLGGIGPIDGAPTIPLNVVADMAGGALYAALGIVAALRQRDVSGEGSYVDVAMLDGVMSMLGMWYSAWGTPTFPGRGLGLAAGEAPFYRCYRCADGGFVAVGAIEPAFFANLWRGVGFAEPVPAHLDRADWPELAARFTEVFASRGRDEWVERLEPMDACVVAVLAPDEVWTHPQVTHRHPGADALHFPVAPRFADREEPAAFDGTDRTRELLTAAGLAADVVDAVEAENAVSGTGGLQWPPVS